MRILGVDPGTWRTGTGILEVRGNRYSVIREELISVPKKLVIADRLAYIYQSLKTLMAKYQPDVLALENLFFGIDVKAMVRIGEARACAMLAASESGISVMEYLPTRVKQAVTGNGRATKSQVQNMVKRLLNLPAVLPPDVSDALAVAICHAHAKNNGRSPESAQLQVPRRTIKRVVKG